VNASNPTDLPRAHVLLPKGKTGSEVFHDALLSAVSAFPELAPAGISPDKRRFKQTLPEAIVTFEAIRASSPRRVDIARHLTESLLGALFFGVPDTEAPQRLEHLLAAPSDSPTLETVRGTAAPGWRPEVTFRKVRYAGAELSNLVRLLRDERSITESAAAGMLWALSRLDRQDVAGRLNLVGERFALLGAGAELAPTPYLVEAGAEVLWIDRQKPALSPEGMAGTVSYPDLPSDIIADPSAVKAAMTAFSGGDRVHVGLFAYAPGRGRELRLAATMDALVRALGAEHVKSVSLLVSPTTPGEVSPADRDFGFERRRRFPMWIKALERTKALDLPGHRTHRDAIISRSIVALQGPTYLAAQYLAKMMTTEQLAVDGLGGRPIAISANVAGITATKSLEHPLFTAGFLGAPTLGIEIFEPTVTRTLMTLLMVSDLLNPDAPGARSLGAFDKARAVAAQSVHGGVRTLPWSIDKTIRVGAMIGLGKRPSLLMGLLKGAKAKKA
jgi:hypothetical protein